MKERKDKNAVKKPFYKKWWFWVIIVILLIGIFGSSGNKQEPDKTPETTEQTDTVTNTKETDTTEPSMQTEAVCRALTEIFVENVVGEKYSMLAFNVEDFELDENEDGTIKILYMPSNAGDGATKVNLTISKNGNAYKIEYALLAGIDEVDLSTVSTQYTEIVDQ
ncbi:MAG: hypothetical protein SO160_10675 [Lachnospiraceae bacterium]|nr:hypothetical protein [Lachnospiraceae bacterium]